MSVISERHPNRAGYEALPLEEPIAPPAAAAEEPAQNENGRNYWEIALCVSVFATGMIFSKSFRIGALFGMFQFSLIILPAYVLMSCILSARQPNNQPAPPDIDPWPLWKSGLRAPILEELVFRGALLPAFEYGLNYVLPVITYEILGAQMALATLTAIVATALIFGAIHYHNPNRDSGRQTILATWQGLTLGWLATHFGLLASIGSHMVNNLSAPLMEFLAQSSAPNRAEQ